MNEWRRLLPADFAIKAIDLGLSEIQSMNSEEIAIDKAQRAYQALKTPVVVEDVSASLMSLHGLPGPFIKYFIKLLGEDALYKLAKQNGERATVCCVIAYFDGHSQFTVKGEVAGTVVAPRGSYGFGFDKIFMPNGHTKTYGEMTDEQKDKISHRSQAILAFVTEFTSRA